MDDPAAPRGPAGAVSPEPGPRTPDPGLSDDPPPFGRSWIGLYTVVAGTLRALIALFALFTTAFK
jgi:hypothetical protein